MTEIHNILKHAENEKIKNAVKDFESITNNNNERMYEAVKRINKLSPKSPLLIQSENGTLTINAKEKADTIAKYFKNVFFKNATPMSEIEPIPMRHPFTANEVRKAAQKMKLNKSPGCDQVPVELIKYAPPIVFNIIADIYNKLAETGDCPNEITHGLLRPLQKPGKPKGSPSNLRPIILLSILRKILASCIMSRISDKIDKEIPPSQAAYRKGRSTTEHVFTCKLVVERTLSAKKETTHLILLDMSKAFDSVNRKLLLEELENTIERDELHIIKSLLNVTLQVKCGNELSEPFQTDTGAPQGDCASANEFTFYLAKALPVPQSNIYTEHSYTNKQITHQEIPDQLIEHNYTTNTQKRHINIDMQYADDISKITSDFNAIEKFKVNIKEKLLERNLKINIDKTEQYIINKKEHSWKKCKILGTLLDTTTDIKRRKTLAIVATQKLKYIFNNKNITITSKTATFTTYIQSIFLYNAETWTLKKADNDSIDSFQRRLIRTFILNVKWPKIATNKEVYERTKIKKWSEVIKKKRLKWMSKMILAKEDTPLAKHSDTPLKVINGHPANLRRRGYRQ